VATSSAQSADDNATHFTQSSVSTKSTLSSHASSKRDDENTSSSVSSAISYTQTFDRVLRYGETIESLFCLNDDCETHHRTLCQEICCGDKSSDVGAWREALKLSIQSSESREGDVGKSLIHLHRRAAARFKLSSERGTESNDILTIWLLYSMILMKYGSSSDSKHTINHIQRVCFGGNSGGFYAALCDGLENHPSDNNPSDVDLDAAVGSLKKCIAEVPIVELVSKISSNVKQNGSNMNARSQPTSERLHNGSRHVRQIALPSLGVKRRANAVGRGTGKPDPPLSTDFQQRTGDRVHLPVDESKPSVLSKLEVRKKFKTDRTTPHPYRHRTSGSDKSSGRLRAILSTTQDDGFESEGSDEVVKTQNNSAENRSHSPKKDCLFKDISPIDQEPTGSMKDMDIDYLLNWDPTKREKQVIIDDKIPIRGTKEKAPPPKITRNDLGYMMNWDPFSQKKGEGTSSEDNKRNGEQRSHQNKVNNMDTIDEASSEASASSSCNGDKAIHSTQTSETDRGTSDKDLSADKTSSDSMISSSSINCAFLPLIENSNIIRVEDQPYCKLGVIGKGGSCKVYRALSRDCDVVALKKVKLDGLNKQAIDGFANEIALLKRLKGNPAIIQLYSAEIDLERKSILLVMEVGEVDLNYVLRQQEMVSSNHGRISGRSSLNMNFIRLTWQQMLTAVHSIHEERIIHSDLKPANFLFVRGALKLIDFGIAKAIEREDTTNVYRETLSGTLSYMSPEAIMDTSTNSKGVRVNRCGRPSDIWSLGCILYQMVYGKTPFADCHGIPQKVLAITNTNHKIHFPSDGVDESAIDAMQSCLQRNPKQRPPIIGKNGLLNEHQFLHGSVRISQSTEQVVKDT